MAERWTPKQLQGLLDGIGSFGWTVLRKRVGQSRPADDCRRTTHAIRAKVRREFGGGGITRGTYSLNQVSEETGYHRTQLKRAMQALGQRWTRTARRGDYLISAEQVEEMVTWLQHDFWSPRHELYCCLRCGTSTQTHYCFGLCERCYRKMRRYSESKALQFTAKALLEVVDLLLRVGGDTNFLDKLLLVLKHGRAPMKKELVQLAEMRDAFEEGDNESGDDCEHGGHGARAAECGGTRADDGDGPETALHCDSSG